MPMRSARPVEKIASREIGPQVLGDQPARLVGDAEIARCHGRREGGEAGGKRRVEIEFLTRLLDLLGRRARPGIERGGIRGNHLRHDEDQEGHAHHHEGGEDHAAQDVAEEFHRTAGSLTGSVR
jgi:hypothetical protein